MRDKRRILRLIVICILLISSTINLVTAENGKEKVVVIPVNGEINVATKNFIKDSVKDIEKRNDVAAILFDINTYGGLIDEAMDIKDIIMTTELDTISFVNNNAQSAGVLITISSDKVAMSNTSTIGSAETIPNTEKILSMWRAVLRDTAEVRGRNPLVIEAMADSDIKIEGVIDSGKLLNLTSKEALDLGVSDLIANSYEEVLEGLDITYSNIEVYDESYQVKLAKYISNPYINSLFLTIAFIGLVIEIFSPGFGVGGTVSIIGFGLYFGGNILAGHSNWTSLILFITGFILLIVEAIVPGFGLPGISGIILLFTGIIMAVSSWSVALFSLSVAIIATAIITFILVKLGYKNKMFDKFILSSNDKEENEIMVDEFSKNDLIGVEGRSISILRPSGFIEINGSKYDAISEDGFISLDSEVVVSKIENNQIYVRRI